MTVPRPVLDKAKVLVLFAFCLLNPFAGWAYLAQMRQASSLRPPSIADTVKPKRLAVLPITFVPKEGDHDDWDWDWAGAFEIDFAERDDLEIVPIVPTPGTLGVERDVLALARGVHADFVLDATAMLEAEEDALRIYARLIRMADATVRWSELYVDEPGALPRIRDDVHRALLRSL